MKFLQEAARNIKCLPYLKLLMLAALAMLIPSAAMAAGGENVVLKFSDQDKIYLYISLGFGIFALIVGWMLAKGVLAASAGSEKMQEVGRAIKEGALAYLQKQVTTMAIFVVILAIGLTALYNNSYGLGTAIWVGISFIGGVSASYIAGYAGMLMAVNGNMRTAHAALTSYKSSLEVAFRSGAVAGMVTVGMGLIGATMIILFAGQDAMKLLIGFGFGGSLAALFMRVGGGIYTKAADVGADLVGKVEAGIPEDDPRNPATIADNVGDNVGDCAGMAADIFESYEVTLVAAIVLGAATAAIFDQATWMRLVLFALMARGVGILASVFGIYAVKGTDDIDSDPLKSIRKGFYVSAVIALVMTAGLAWYMMGGQGNMIKTHKLVSFLQPAVDVASTVDQEINKLAAEKGVENEEIELSELKGNAALQKLGVEDYENDQVARSVYQSGVMAQEEDLEAGKGYSLIDPATSDSPVLDYSILVPQMNNPDPDSIEMPEPVFMSLRDAAGPNGLKFAIIEVEQRMRPSPMNPVAQSVKFRTGALTADVEKTKAFLATQDNENVKLAVVDEVPLQIFANKDNKVAFGFDADPSYSFQMTPQQGYFAESADEAKAKYEQQINGEMVEVKREVASIFYVQSKPVPWYLFFAAIAFGVIMAFAIEALTDYYVSTHKKPTKEVAGVATAGPAPMIIQGFAYAMESSVFMVFAIVFALITPLFLFNPDTYGSAILSFYGIALVGLGLLTTTGYILAMDTFGPISDNAQGVYEMSGEGHDNEYGSKAVQRLDAAGNTTKALTKGFAITTAVVAAVALFHSYLESAQLETIGLRLDVPEIFLGLLIGGAAPYLFGAFSINAVGRAAFQLINEVRRQFKADAGIMAGTSKPDYGRCVAIVTQAAQKELIGPGILAIALPVAVAFGFAIGKEPTIIDGVAYNLTGAQALGGFLAGTILSGQLLAVLLANSGGMWDNAKKLIEDGLHGGKGTEAHKAGVVCDTVGDPFKDTAGPALNPLIKVMNLVALLLAPFVIQPWGNGVLIAVTLGCVLLLTISIVLSKKGSMSTALQAAQDEEAEAEAQATPKKTIRVEEDEPEASLAGEDKGE